MSIHGVRRLFFTGVALALASPFVTAAQYVQPPLASETWGPARDWSDDIPAHIAFVEGSVTLERDGRLEPAEMNVALLSGDRLRTTGGRVEILFADGSALALDEYSTLDLLSESLARLLDGRLRVSIARAPQAVDYRIDAPAASVLIRAAGEYRVAVRDGRDGRTEVDLVVNRGSAELLNEFGRTLVRPGTHAIATPGLAPSLPYVVNSAAWDDFDRWGDRQRSVRVGTVSTRYLPDELSYYSGAFDHYGHWNYVAPHGYVWYPRVATGWRPYSQGRWSFTAHFGWFWVGIDRWSWPTHHYGRWGLSSGGWYWIPDRRWAPAWVSWSTAPGYVSWCPLGYDGRAVVGIGYADPWLAWTVVPARVFVPNIWVTQHVVIHNTIAPAIRAQFVERPVAPIAPPVATARRIEPIRAPTIRATAVPRADAVRIDAVRAGDGARPSRVVQSESLPASAPVASAAGQARARDAVRGQAQPETTAPRAVPDRSRVATGQQPWAGMPGVTVPQVDTPRATVPAGGAARSRVPMVEPPRSTPPVPSTPSTGGAPRSRAPAVEPPRPAPPSYQEPPPGAGGARPRSPVVDPPRSTPPSAQVPRPGGGAARSRTPAVEPPPVQPAPDRSPSRTPDRSGPPSTAPAPSSPPAVDRGRGGDPPASPPAGPGAAVPRARGAGGGGG